MDDNLFYKKSFITHVLNQYAVTILLMMIITALFGRKAESYSTMFTLGSQGISLPTLLQLLLFSLLISVMQVFYFSERIIKHMMSLWRTILMLITILIISLIFIILFDWFPLNSLSAWLGYFICFGGGTLGGSLYMILKTRKDSKRYEELLTNYKNRRGGKKDYE